MNQKNPLPKHLIVAFFMIHGLLYSMNFILVDIIGIWNKYFNVIFGNVTMSDTFLFLPLILGASYVVVGYGLLANEHWARIGLFLLCLQGIFIEFPFGVIVYLSILIYSLTPSFSKSFPKTKGVASYQLAGVSVIVVAIVAILIMTGVSQGILSFTSYKIRGHALSYDSAESKIIDVEEYLGQVDVLIEFTGDITMALQQQDETIIEIAPYITEIKQRFSEASNGIIASVDTRYLLDIAENENVLRITKVKPSFRFLPYELEQAQMQRSTSYLQLGTEELWNQGLTGKGITVAVMDTGIREDHPDLQRDGQSIVVGGLHLYGEYVHDHGTMVASCIAGQSEDVKGIAPDVNLLNIEVFHWETIGGVSYLSATNADILQGFEFVANWKKLTGDYVILSCSWGVSAQSYSHDADVCIESANRLAVQYNIPVIAAAGNSGPTVKPYTSIPYQVMAPAGGEHVLAVGAIDPLNNIAPFSSRGPYYNGLNKPDVVAPGVNVIVLTPTGVDVASGTSFSCPYVSGIAALLVQENTDVSSEQLYDALKRGATDLGTEGYDYEYGYGVASGEGSYALITQSVSQFFILIMFIAAIGIGLIIIAYPMINKKLRKR